jgi:hypothetical protein
MYEVILSLILSKADFNLIETKENAENNFYVGEIRVGWQYDKEKNVFFRYRKQDKQQICLPGFR